MVFGRYSRSKHNTSSLSHLAPICPGVICPGLSWSPASRRLMPIIGVKPWPSPLQIEGTPGVMQPMISPFVAFCQRTRNREYQYRRSRRQYQISYQTLYYIHITFFCFSATTQRLEQFASLSLAWLSHLGGSSAFIQLHMDCDLRVSGNWKTCLLMYGTGRRRQSSPRAPSAR
jgi:hypothetical protein